MLDNILRQVYHSNIYLNDILFMSTKKYKKIETLAKQLLAAGDPNRLKIMCLIIKKKYICVSDVSNTLDISIATTSYHLQALTKAKLLKPAREGKKICYSLTNTDIAKDLRKIICKYN